MANMKTEVENWAKELLEDHGLDIKQAVSATIERKLNVSGDSPWSTLVEAEVSRKLGKSQDEDMEKLITSVIGEYQTIIQGLLGKAKDPVQAGVLNALSFSLHKQADTGAVKKLADYLRKHYPGGKYSPTGSRKARASVKRAPVDTTDYVGNIFKQILG